MDLQSYFEVIAWLENVPKYSQKDGLCNMFRLMDRLGNVQNKYGILHVAGTNGKGSCVAMLTQILKTQGYRVGRYISPHLVSYTERIAIDGQDISEKEFLRIANRVRTEAEAIYAEGEKHPTFFELLTAIAFVAFADAKVDFVVLETGVGGRLDATNIIEKPILSLIASISLDHTKVLGNTVFAIAGEKAGIIKKNCPVVCEQNPPDAVEVIAAKATEMHAPLYLASQLKTELLSCNEEGITLNVKGKGFGYKNLRCPLSGLFQVANICAVLAAAEVLLDLGIIDNRRIVCKGISDVSWPGRMEKVNYKGRSFIIDGAHNPDAAKALVEYLKMVGKTVTLVYSALAKKDVAGVVKELGRSPEIKHVIFAPLRSEDHPISFADARELWYSERKDISPELAENTEDALNRALKSTDELVLCAGSLYFVGEIKELL